MPTTPSTAALSSAGLGLDAGGTQTRWALAVPGEGVVAQGSAAAFSGTQMADDQGRRAIREALVSVREQGLKAHPAAARLRGLCAGITGFDGDGAGPITALITEVFAVDAAAVRLYNDIELACRAAFAPGTGLLVYAGTGSVAAYIDADGVQHRAGGRGGLIDDGGSGYWIACTALRAVWRGEDRQPGVWQRSGLARALFEHIGSSDWSATRAFVYGGSRGQIGALSLAVAQAAQGGDGAALAILAAAGDELARLAHALIGRHGARPVHLAGRVFGLHPVIEARLRAHLEAASVPVQSATELHAHRRAAEMAAGQGA